jgi:hypothetical protein
MKGTMNHAKTIFSTEICASAINSVVQYLAPPRYTGVELHWDQAIMDALPVVQSHEMPLGEQKVEQGGVKVAKELSDEVLL